MKWAKAGLTVSLWLCLVNQGCTVEEAVESSYTPSTEPPPAFPLNGTPSPPAPLPNSDHVYQKARSVTVKVLSGQTSGSGILLEQQGNTYTVLTNHHVLIFGETTQNYRIVTPDGRVYPAKSLKTVNFQDKDLALLTFSSHQSYQVARLSPSKSVKIGQIVFAAGFPFEDDGHSDRGFVLNQGTVAEWSPQPFGGGYQIGYTSTVKKGMSGGPLFNEWGEIIGVNGVHKYPLWGNPYVFRDGSRASLVQKQEMSQYSWAIPLETVNRFFKGERL